MACKTYKLFTLDDDGRFRLGCDDLQWIIERGRPDRARKGKDSGYRGISFICSDKTILHRCLREKNVPVSCEAKLFLHALPSTFRECRDMIRAGGIAAFLSWLDKERVGMSLPLPERSEAA